MIARLVPAIVLGTIGTAALAAWLGTELLGFDQALPVLVGEIPSEGSLELAVAQAGLLIVARLAAVVLAPAALIAAAVDALTVLLWRVRSMFVGAKGPTPRPVGSTGGGL